MTHQFRSPPNSSTPGRLPCDRRSHEHRSGLPRARALGFSLIELLVVITIITLLVSLLLGAISGARKTARLAVCMNNMSTMGKTLGTYAATFQDRIYAFSWTKETKQSLYPDLNSHTSDDLIAASDQAIDILRRRAGREDIKKITNLIPHPILTHLVVQDFLTARLPGKEVVCPDDRPRNAWASAPQAFDRKEVVPYPGGQIAAGTNFGKIWPYTSSYYTVVATFERTPGSIKQLADLLYLYKPQSARLGGNRLGDCVFPSQKVLTYDTIQRHFGKNQTYWAYDDARTPLTFFDASVSVRLVGNSNPGWDPTNPAENAPLRITYKPDVSSALTQWQPRARSADGADVFDGRFTWTRGALRGVDFGGTEINTGQPKH